MISANYSRISSDSRIISEQSLRKTEQVKNGEQVPVKDDGLDVVSFSENKTKTYQDLADEWREYTNSIWGKPEPEFNTREEREQYWIKYYDKYIDYCDKILNCSDIPEDEKAEWQRMKENAETDRNYHYRDLNNWKKENNIKTESFTKVFDEMKQNVPDRTTTIDEKELAISYIERMLSCDDVPEDMKNYWENKKSVIEMEIQNIKNSQVPQGTEKVDDVWKEFKDFIDKYKTVNDNLSADDKYENRSTYCNTYKSFIARLLNCSDITESQKAEFAEMEYNIDSDWYGFQLDYQAQKENPFSK